MMWKRRWELWTEYEQSSAAQKGGCKTSDTDKSIQKKWKHV